MSWLVESKKNILFYRMHQPSTNSNRNQAFSHYRMPGFEWRMPMDIPWFPKTMDFERQQETRKKASSTSWLNKISPLFDVYPLCKIHWGFDGMPMRPNMKISRWHVFKVVHLWNVRQGQGGFRCLCGVFIKCLCLSPLRISICFAEGSFYKTQCRDSRVWARWWRSVLPAI